MRETAWCGISLVLTLAMSCGTVSQLDAGADDDAGSADAGTADAGSRDAGRPDAGRPDAGPPQPFDAGPPPPRGVFGSMTVNGQMYELSTGFGTQSARSHQLNLGTSTMPRIDVRIVFPADGGAHTMLCGGPENVLFAAQYTGVDGGVAFFNLNPACTIALSQVALTTDGGAYDGTFAGTLNFEPRSSLDAGFQVLTITNGTFHVVRTF